MKTVCTEYFQVQFLKNLHPTGVSETPICHVIKGLQWSTTAAPLNALLERSGNPAIGANERLAHVKYPGYYSATKSRIIIDSLRDRVWENFQRPFQRLQFLPRIGQNRLIP